MASGSIDLSVLTGTRVTPRVTFTNDDTNAVDDPDAVVVKVREPAGTTATLTFGIDADVTRLSVGVYQVQWVLDVPGVWWFQFAAVGAPSTVNAVAEIAVRAIETAL